MANTSSLCPHCGKGRMIELVCYDECDACGSTAARPGCMRFRQLHDGDRFLAGFDLADRADVFVRGYPEAYQPVPGEFIEPNAYTEGGRWVAFGPEAPVKKIS